jgi:hypothetical protein
MCAILDGKSVKTTMGFAGVSGLPMATGSGDVPPGALFYLLLRKLFDDAALEKMSTNARACPASAATCACYRRARIRWLSRRSSISFT